MSLLSNSILVSDLHLTDHPRDEYRWGLFPWLREQIKRNNTERLFILGDLCDKKDYHSSLLVNRIVQELTSLNTEVLVLRGNHDGIDPDLPYFLFLNSIANVSFIWAPTFMEDTLLLPHSRDPETDWSNAYVQSAMKKAEFVLMHATITGAKSETEFELEGIPRELLASVQGKIYSGDVHVPQRLPKMPYFEYVGAPYPIRFGDKFTGRMIRYSGGIRQDDLKYPCLHRWSVTVTSVKELNRFDTEIGDQMKIRVELPRSELMSWEQHRKAVMEWGEQRQIELCGLELTVFADAVARETTKTDERFVPADQFREFCKREKMEPSLVEMGEFLMEER